MDIFGEIFSLCCPLGVSTLFLRKGLWFMEKMYIEEKIKDIDRMALFRYLISDRVFVESLSVEDLKKYSKSPYLLFVFAKSNYKKFIERL